MFVFLLGRPIVTVQSWSMTSTRISAKLDTLPAIAGKMFFGSLSSTYRTCGKSPTASATRASATAATSTSVTASPGAPAAPTYCPPRLEQQVREGIEAWQRSQQIAMEVAEHNRLGLGLVPRRRPKSKEKAR